MNSRVSWATSLFVIDDFSLSVSIRVIRGQLGFLLGFMFIGVHLSHRSLGRRRIRG
jgi:hypothetical protein